LDGKLVSLKRPWRCATFFTFLKPIGVKQEDRVANIKINKNEYERLLYLKQGKTKIPAREASGLTRK
jgi:hypothetical protein